MAQIKIQNVQKNFDHILSTVGSQSFIDWQKFSHSSAQVINSIDDLNKKMSIYRQCQHRNFIQKMKKLKSLDLPDLIGAVKNKKLPKEALRGILPRFKPGQNDKIELVDSIQTLKQDANKQLEQYISKNNKFIQQLKKYLNFVQQKTKQFGFTIQQALPSAPIKSTVKFNLSQQKSAKIASDIKIQFIPGTKYIGLKTYSQIVGGSYQLIRQQHQKLSKDARIKQRQNSKNPAKYLDVMNQYLLNGQALVIQGQRLIAKNLGLLENQLEQSQIVMVKAGYGNHLMAMQSQLRTKVKQSIPPTQQVPYQVATQIIAYQTKLLQQRKNELKTIFDGLQKTQQNVQIIPMILALILNDMVYQKYGYQQEDFMKNINEEIISQNPELSKIFVEMEVAIIKLMEFIGIVTNQVGKLLQQGAMQRGQAVQKPTPMQGILPDSNPLQMLQKQQIQQLLAAQKKQSL